MWAVAAAMCWAESGLARDCPCNQGRVAIRTASVGAGELPPAPVPEIGNPAFDPSAQPPPLPPAPAASPPAANPAPPVPAAGGRSTGAVLTPQAASGPAILGGYQPQAGMNRWGMLPPPGTLGRTYQRRSALIPDDEHPRIGVVVVKLPEQANVSARGMKVKWTGEEWRLESSQPLVPGVPHIYAVTAEWETTAGKVQQTRWVRLIMGRVVDLEF
jgi:hypothetical protein